jgi:hypothetical protein
MLNSHLFEGLLGVDPQIAPMVEGPAKLSGGAPRLLFERVVVADRAKEVVVEFPGDHWRGTRGKA